MRLCDNRVEELTNSLVNFAENAKAFNHNDFVPGKKSSMNGSTEWHKMNSAPANSATSDNARLRATPVASSSGATADYNGSDGRLVSLSRLHPPPPLVPPPPPRRSSSFLSGRHSTHSHFQLTTNDTATSFASEQGDNKMRLHRNVYNRNSKGCDSGTYCSDIKNNSAADAAGENASVGIIGGGGNKIDNSRMMNRTMSRDGHFSAEQATTRHLRSQVSVGLVGGIDEGSGRGINEFLIDNISPALSNNRKLRRSRSLSEAKTSLSIAKTTITHISPVPVESPPVRVTHSDDDSLARCNDDSGDSYAVGNTATPTAFVKKIRQMRHGSLDKDPHHTPPPPPPSFHNHARRGSDSKLGETRGSDAGHKVTANSGLKGTSPQVKRRLGKLDSKPENDGDDELMYGVGSNTRIHICKTKVNNEPKKMRSQPQSQSTKNPQMPPEGRRMRTDNNDSVRESVHDGENDRNKSTDDDVSIDVKAHAHKPSGNSQMPPLGNHSPRRHHQFDSSEDDGESANDSAQTLKARDLQRTPPPPPPSRDRGRRIARASSRGRPTPVSSIKGLADAENSKTEHQKHQGRRILSKGVVVLTSLRSRSLSRARSSSRQRAGSVGRVGSSMSASLAQYEGSSASGGDNRGELSSSEQELMLSTNQKNRVAGFLRGALPDMETFDRKTGRCKKHPSILLAKKSKFRMGWDIIKVECPLCYEARKKHRRQFKLGRGDADHHHKFNDSSAIVSATSTFATKTTEGGSEIEEHSRSSERTNHSFEDSVPAAKDTTSTVRVARMPYTTPWGEVGWYTGMVNSRGIPNGQGRMRTKTGNIIEGKWTDGYSDDEKLGRRSGKMTGGFTPKSTPWNDDQSRGGGSAVWSAPVASVSPGQVTTVGMMSSHSPGGNYPYPTST